jgi:hypothetical protein
MVVHLSVQLMLQEPQQCHLLVQSCVYGGDQELAQGGILAEQHKPLQLGQQREAKPKTSSMTSPDKKDNFRSATTKQYREQANHTRLDQQEDSHAKLEQQQLTSRTFPHSDLILLQLASYERGQLGQEASTSAARRSRGATILQVY